MASTDPHGGPPLPCPVPEPSDAAGKLACSIQEDRPKNASSERASLAPELKPAVVGEQKGEAKASIANVPSVLTLMREYAIFQQMLVSLVKSDEKVWVAVKERAEASLSMTGKQRT